jgi:hypothetical protein
MSDLPVYEPRLFSFLTKDGRGVEAFLRQKTVVLQILREQNIDEATMTSSGLPLVLDTGRWYHIAIVHSSAARTLGQPEVSFFINGEQSSPACVLKYPDVTGGMEGYVGTSAVQSVAVGGAGQRIIPAMPFCGQMSSLYFFDSAVPYTDIRTVHSLGPNYMYSFEATDDSIMASETGDLTQDQQSVLAGGLSAQIWLSYNAKACDGIMAFDTTPEGIGRTTGLNARLLGSTSASGTRSCVTRKLRDTMSAMGGVKLLFPLFMHLARLCHGIAQPADVQDGSHTESQKFLNNLFIMFQRALTNRNNLNFMAQSNGFGVIQNLLRHVPPESFSLETLTFISDLGNSLSDGQLQAFSHRCMLLDFEVWIHTAPLVQAEAIRQLRRICHTNPSMFQDLCGVQGVLDIVEKFYWSVPDDDSHVSPVTGGTQSTTGPQRPSPDDLRNLRRQLLEILHASMEQQYADEDLEHIIAFLCNVEDGELLRDVVVELRSVCEVQTRAFTAIRAPSKLLLLARLLEHDFEPVQCETIMLLASLVTFEQTDADPEVLPLLRQIVLCVSSRAATDEMKQTLLCASLGSSDADISRTRESDEIRHPVFIHLLFEAYSQCLKRTATDSEARAAAWDELAVLLKATISYFSSSVQSCAQFCSVDGWQEVCVPLLTMDGCPADIEGMLCQIFQAVHLHSFRYRSRGWQMLASSLAHLQAAESIDGEWIAISRRFCTDTLQSVHRVIESGVWKPEMRDSISHIMLLVEDVMFSQSAPGRSESESVAAPVLSRDGTEPSWPTQDLAEAAWSILDRPDLRFTDFVDDDAGLIHTYPGGLARISIRILVASIVESIESKSAGKYLQRLHKYLVSLPPSTDQTNAIHVYSMVRVLPSSLRSLACCF